MGLFISARRSDLKHSSFGIYLALVFTFRSLSAAVPQSKFLIAPFLLYSESKSLLRGMDWTILRNSRYLDPIAERDPDSMEMGRLPYSVRDGRITDIARDDLARVGAAEALGTDPNSRWRMVMPMKIKWDEIPWEEVTENVSRKVIMGDRLMMVMYRFQAGLTWPEERHVAEQGGYLLKGKHELYVEGKKHVLLPGDSYFIESDVPHYSHFVEETILIDVFSPPRKELIQKDNGFAPYASLGKGSRKD